MKSFVLLASLLFLLSPGLLLAQWTYSVTDKAPDQSHSFFTAALKYDGNSSFYVNQTNPVITTLNFTYFFISPSHLVVRFTDPNNARWEVPHSPPFPSVNYSNRFAPYEDALLTVDITDSPFSLKVTRKSTQEVLFDSSVGDLIYSDYYLQIATALPTPNIYGFGERTYKLNLGPNGTYTLLNKDNAGTEDGTTGNNAYGYHPVYLQREKSNKFHMNLLRSSTPMDVQIQSGKTLTYKVLGGIFDFNFFVGDGDRSDPETVVKQYHKYLGGWILQPFWSFGFHQCRYGYPNIEALNNVLGNFSAYNLPLDAIWSDILYMDHTIDFTINTHNYPPDQMRNMLQEYKKRWIPIIDAGIALNNDIHKIGLNNDVYLKDPNGTYLQGSVWPGKVNYPDFFNPNTSLFWHLGLRNLYEQVPYSGIWLDMNEVSNFVAGETDFVPDPNDLFNLPPYRPSKSNERIYTKTTRMDAVHYGGIPELYLHNTFGMMEGKATLNFLKTVNDLVFILSRSTFYGSGKYTAHWTGDNGSNYKYMALSVPGIMNFNFFGIPMTGADICGFNGDTTEELCSRWFQVGALYPFARDHSGMNTKSQEPYAMGPTVLQTSRVNLGLRYAILRYYYSLFLQQNGTGTIFRPLFFEFSEDQELYDLSLNYTDSQFLIGKGLMAAPVLSQGVEERLVYFPVGETWFDFVTGEMVKQAGVVNYPAPLNATAPLFLRGGSIIPIQNVTNVRRTEDLDNLYRLVIAFNPFTAALQKLYEKKISLRISDFSKWQIKKKKKILKFHLSEKTKRKNLGKNEKIFFLIFFSPSPKILLKKIQASAFHLCSFSLLFLSYSEKNIKNDC